RASGAPGAWRPGPGRDGGGAGTGCGGLTNFGALTSDLKADWAEAAVTAMRSGLRGRAGDTVRATRSQMSRSSGVSLRAMTRSGAVVGVSLVRRLGGARLPGQQIAGLAVQFAAQGVQRREADGPRLAGLEDRQIGQGHAHAIGQLGQRHAPFEQDAVKLDADGHETGTLSGKLDGQFGFAAQTGTLAENLSQHEHD